MLAIQVRKQKLETPHTVVTDENWLKVGFPPPLIKVVLSTLTLREQPKRTSRIQEEMKENNPVPGFSAVCEGGGRAADLPCCCWRIRAGFHTAAMGSSAVTPVRKLVRAY